MNRTKNDRPEPRQYKTIPISEAARNDLAESVVRLVGSNKLLQLALERQTVETRRLQAEIVELKAQIEANRLELLEEPYSDD